MTTCPVERSMSLFFQLGKERKSYSSTVKYGKMVEYTLFGGD